ncbi:MAG: Gx transporter family protein [bacterium]
MPTKTSVNKIAMLTALASVLQIAESFFPQPIPGVKLGMANMIVLIAMVQEGFETAFEISVLRTVISAAIMGSFLSPAFLLSLSAAVTSTCVMGVFLGLQKKTGMNIFSLTGVSIAGAITHNAVQIILVYFLLIKHSGIFWVLPWLGISAVGMGLLTGLAASAVCEKLEDKTATNKFKKTFALKKGEFTFGPESDKKSALHAFPADIKILAVLGIAIAVIFFEKLSFYGIVFGALITMAFFTGALKHALTGIKYTWAFILFSFLTPLLLTPEGKIIFDFIGLRVTEQGFKDGAEYALRISILVTASSLAFKTSSPAEITQGIRKLLKPFSGMGLNGERQAHIITKAMEAMPELWARTKEYIKRHRVSGTKGIKGLLAALTGIILVFYIDAGEIKNKR